MDNEKFDKKNLLTEKEYLCIRMLVEQPELAKWKIYQKIFDCDEKSAKSNASKFFSRPIVKHKIDSIRVIRAQSLDQSVFWDTNRLVYEYTALSQRCLYDGHPIFDRQGIEIGSKPDYGTAKGCYDSIGKIIGAFEVDNNQKKNETTINLGDYFKKKELE